MSEIDASVGTGDGVKVGVKVGDGVAVGPGVAVGAIVGVSVGKGVDGDVGVAVGTSETGISTDDGTEYRWITPLFVPTASW
jgi:hypothetical protein